MAKAIKTGAWDFLAEGLWLEGIWTFALCWRFWLAGALIFTLILTPVDYFSSNYMNTLKGFAHQKPVGYLYWSLFRFVDAALIYFFTACFLNQQPIKGDAFEPKPKDFLCMGGTFFLLVSVFAGAWAVSLGSHDLTGWLFSSSSKTISLATLAFTGRAAVMVLLAVSLIYLLMLRLACAVPLAINHIEKPLRCSYEITKGNGWRILSNGVAFFLFAIVPVMVPCYIVASVLQSAPEMPLAAARGLLASFVHAAVQTLCCGLGAAFYYAVARALYAEFIIAKPGTDRRAAQRPE